MAHCTRWAYAHGPGSADCASDRVRRRHTRAMPSALKPDVGRAILVPVFCALLTINVSRLLDTDAGRSTLALAGTLTAMAFYAVLVVFYLRRGPASETDRRPGRWLAAGGATFSPFLIPIVGPGDASAGRIAVGSALVTLGVALAVWALLHLRTNISVVPQSRGLAASGPYRLFRHPLYAFECISAVGLVLIHGGGWAWLVVVALIVLQVLRAHWEEVLLREQVKGYAAYAARTPGFR